VRLQRAFGFGQIKDIDPFLLPGHFRRCREVTRHVVQHIDLADPQSSTSSVRTIPRIIPEFVSVGQHHFEHAALLVLTAYHGGSFDPNPAGAPRQDLLSVTSSFQKLSARMRGLDPMMGHRRPKPVDAALGIPLSTQVLVFSNIAAQA
jgi:hypothetical protein